MSPKVTIIGAGIIGLPTAIAIQQRCRNVEVELIADKFSPNLTSDVAAGLIWPYCVEEEESKIIKWTQVTIDKIKQYMVENPGEGAERMSGYLMSTKVDPNPFWAPLMENFKILSSEDIRSVSSNAEHKAGYFFTTWYLESSKYLQHCLKLFLKNGGLLRSQHIDNLLDIKSDVIVNCCGLASGALTGDTLIHPVRGQVIRVSCPAVKHFFVDDHDDVIILGGTADKDEWDTTVNENTAKRIVEGNCKNVPTLRSAKILSHHVGLRPARKSICLKSESIKRPNGTAQQVVHNYGHGGSGVTLHWGCALDAADLVFKKLQTSKI